MAAIDMFYSGIYELVAEDSNYYFSTKKIYFIKVILRLNFIVKMANNFDLQIKWLSGSKIEIQSADTSSLSGDEKVLIMQGGVAKETTVNTIRSGSVAGLTQDVVIGGTTLTFTAGILTGVAP